MSSKWPMFITRDLGDTEADSVEMQRRWEVYDREMRALIDKGGLYQDADGWWVHSETGELVGPDPELERPSSEAELASMRPFGEAMPDLAEAFRHEIAKRGRPPLTTTKTPVTIRLDADIVEYYKAEGKGWQSRINAALRKVAGL